MADPRILVAADPVALAAKLVSEGPIGASSPQPRLAVPGGSAAAAIAPIREALEAAGGWSKVRLTWVDERCVPEADPRSNRGEAYRQGYLDERSLPALELPLHRDGETPSEAVARARVVLDRAFDGALDVTLLGMGEDGHVASIFVGRPTHEGMVVHVPDSPKPPASRITLTRAVLGTATRTVVLATGEKKRGALERLARGDVTMPAFGLPGLVIVTDLEIEA